MPAVLKGHQHKLPTAAQLLPADPLYKRASREDEHAKPLSDFMMVIPRLHTRPQQLIQDTGRKIEAALERHASTVVFADLNLKINGLWAIARPQPGVCWNLPVEINAAVPDALLVAQPAF